MQGKGERTVGPGVCVQGGQLGLRYARSCPPCAVVRSPRQAAFRFRPLAFSLRSRRTPTSSQRLCVRGRGAPDTWSCGREAVASVHTLAGLPEDTGERDVLPPRASASAGPGALRAGLARGQHRPPGSPWLLPAERLVSPWREGASRARTGGGYGGWGVCRVNRREGGVGASEAALLRHSHRQQGRREDAGRGRARGGEAAHSWFTEACGRRSF